MNDLCKHPKGEWCNACDQSGCCMILTDTDFHDKLCPFFGDEYTHSRSEIQLEIQRYAKAKGEFIPGLF